MIRLAISVEGETGEAFVNNILRDHLLTRSVDSIPVLLNGNVTVERLASEMAKLVWNFDHVTSLVDFYGFRDKGNVTRRELEQTIFKTIDRDIGRNWDQSRASPYVQQYEFEGLLFSNVTAFASAINLPNQSVAELRNIRSHFQTPEDINDDRDTATTGILRDTGYCDDRDTATTGILRRRDTADDRDTARPGYCDDRDTATTGILRRPGYCDDRDTATTGILQWQRTDRDTAGGLLPRPTIFKTIDRYGTEIR